MEGKAIHREFCDEGIVYPFLIMGLKKRCPFINAENLDEMAFADIATGFDNR